MVRRAWTGLVVLTVAMAACQATRREPARPPPPPQPEQATTAFEPLDLPPLEPLDPLTGAPALQSIPDPEVAPSRPPRYRIDRSLERFSRVVSSLRAAREPGRPERAPRAVRLEWNRLLGRLDRYLDQPPRKTPAVELVRTRVTVEAELAADLEAWRLPPGLADRVRSRLAYLDHRMEVARARALPVAQGDTPKLVWPLEPVRITSTFGWRSDPLTGARRFHFGADLRGAPGQLVLTAAPGLVTWAGWNGGHGRHVEVVHPGGWVTRYSHLSEIAVRKGDRLGPEDAVGAVGSSGRTTGPHLHFEIWRHGDARDPEAVLGPTLVAASGTGGVGGGEE